MIQVHSIYHALYFYYYYISFTSDHQALDLRGWGPLVYTILGVGKKKKTNLQWKTSPKPQKSKSSFGQSTLAKGTTGGRTQ